MVAQTSFDSPLYSELSPPLRLGTQYKLQLKVRSNNWVAYMLQPAEKPPPYFMHTHS